MRMLLVVVGALWLSAAPLYAADIGVEGKKLVIQDTLAHAGDAQVVFVSRYHAPVAKGSGTDVSAIDAQFEIAYVNGLTSGSFVMPSGGNWLVNIARIAKYVNKPAPLGGGVRVGLIKPDGKLKLTGKSLGDSPIDILGAGDPGPSGVLTVFTVNNGGETNRHCTLFVGCVYALISQGTGAQLTCRNGTAAACP